MNMVPLLWFLLGGEGKKKFLLQLCRFWAFLSHVVVRCEEIRDEDDDTA